MLNRRAFLSGLLATTAVAPAVSLEPVVVPWMCVVDGLHEYLEGMSMARSITSYICYADPDVTPIQFTGYDMNRQTVSIVRTPVV